MANGIHAYVVSPNGAPPKFSGDPELFGLRVSLGTPTLHIKGGEKITCEIENSPSFWIVGPDADSIVLEISKRIFDQFKLKQLEEHVKPAFVEIKFVEGEDTFYHWVKRCPNPNCSWGLNLELHRNYEYVYCKSCGLSGPIKDGYPKDAIEDWNNLPRTKN